MTKEQVRSVLGDPEQWGGTSRKYREPSIWKYGEIEFWFKVKPNIKPQPDAPLVCVFNNATHEVIMKDEPKDQPKEESCVCYICKGTGIDRNLYGRHISGDNGSDCMICDGEGWIYFEVD